MKKGKKYLNRKKKADRPEGDFYETPYCLTKKLLEKKIFRRGSTILEPAAGNGAISTVLLAAGFKVIDRDLYRTGHDFMRETEKHRFIITNPPFSEWDKFVIKAKKISKKFAFIGRLNFFGTYQRWENGIFDGLKHLYVFNRMIDYRSPIRDDGFFHVGGLVTGWFVWVKGYKGRPMIEYLDIQNYARLGNFKDQK